MARSYTPNLGIIKPADGEEDGVWGDLVNDNMDILDVAINGVLSLSLSGTSSTLTTSDGLVSNGQYRLLVLGGSPSGTHTITISPNDADKVYFVNNTTAQSVVFTQGSGGNVTIATGDSAVIYANGGGAGAAVANLTDHFAMSSVKITGGSITGITDLAVADGGTGASDAATARTNLGLVIGTNVQAYDAELTAIAALAVTDGNFIVGNGTTWVAESGATARTSLGLGTLATQNGTFSDAVLGPASATDNAVARFDATTGKLVQNSAVTIADTGVMTVVATDAGTNTVLDAMQVQRQSSGTPAVGIGVGVEFAVETAAGNTEIGAVIEAVTTDVTAASEDFDLVFKTMAAGAAASEAMRIKSTNIVDVVSLAIGGTTVTSTAAELNILDGVTSTAAELNLVDGSVAGTIVNNKAVVYGAAGQVNATTLQIGGTSITSTAAELNILDGVTSTAAELNLVDGSVAGTIVNSKAVVYGAAGEVNATTLQIAGTSITATAAELNTLDGITATVTELNYTDGVTSAIQTQLNAKAALASPTFTGTPAAPTATAGTNTTQLATTAFVQTAVVRDYELISTSTISSAVAAVDFTGFNNSVYGSYAFTLHSVIPVTDNVDFYMRYSVDGGATFISTNTYDWHVSSQTVSTVTPTGGELGNTLFLTYLGVGSAAGETGVSGVVNLFTPDGSRKTYTYADIGYDNLQGGFSGVQQRGRNSTTTAVNAVRFYFSSGNVESGRISMYGIRRV